MDWIENNSHLNFRGVNPNSYHTGDKVSNSGLKEIVNIELPLPIFDFINYSQNDFVRNF